MDNGTIALIIVVGGAVYAAGFILTLMVQVQMPVDTPLARLRAYAWPIYWLTGWPAGAPMRMD